MSKEDPKHGRWILPVVVAALIGFTYLFVNALPPAEIPVGTTTTAVAAETTTTTVAATTTTTLPADIAALQADALHGAFLLEASLAEASARKVLHACP